MVVIITLFCGVQIMMVVKGAEPIKKSVLIDQNGGCVEPRMEVEIVHEITVIQVG